MQSASTLTRLHQWSNTRPGVGEVHGDADPVVVLPTAEPHHGTAPGLAQVIAFRPRILHESDVAHEAPRHITWSTRGELVEHAAYREVPSGRIGWYLGQAPVPALSRLQLGEAVLVFRSRGDGQLFTYSLFDALSGVAFEDVD